VKDPGIDKCENSLGEMSLADAFIGIKTWNEEFVTKNVKQNLSVTVIPPFDESFQDKTSGLGRLA
jgi:hypothetical protein